MTRADFLPAGCNADALAAVDRWHDWPDRRLLLCGPRGCGRTHLGRIWAADTQAPVLNGARLDSLPEPAPAYLVDDAHCVAGVAAREEALFHLYNRAEADAAPLMLTAPDTPGTWGVALPDLSSRLQTFAVTRLAAPDDELLYMVLIKLFDDRQLSVSPETVKFLTRRIDRSLRNAVQVVQALDHAALTLQKRISRAMAADVLAGLAPDTSSGADDVRDSDAT
ncbi:MAG: chromosomal replication initiator DnaA [Rhodobacteraceae bacterium]|nr:chromosomal replication initiator DnaA [Paracoccaceae bacterium]